jgi:hypothetical protein
MTTYVISYDLRQPGKDYKSLMEAIKSYGVWWHNLGSTWVIVTPHTAKQVRDHLAAHIDANDGLLVVKSGAEGAWSGFTAAASQWLQTNL